MRSSRNRRAPLLAIAIAAAAVVLASAHRRDEYLEAARLDIAPERIDVRLDLTPGISLAGRVIAELDRDVDGVVSEAEARAYATLVERDTRLEIDGRVLPMRLVDSRAAPVDAMKDGVGTMQMRFSAAVPPLTPGAHRLRFTNAHHPDIGVYLANVLVPTSDRVVVTSQDRDADQREFMVGYQLASERSGRRDGALLAIGGGVLAAAAVAIRRSTRPSRT